MPSAERLAASHGVKVTADDIAQLLASPPPRLLPAHVARAAKSARASALSIVVLPLLFGLGGIWLAVASFPVRALDEMRLGRESVRTAGTIVNVARADSALRDTTVFSYKFSYKPKGEAQPRTGLAYAVDQTWERGDILSVRYVPARPEVACPVGARLDKDGLVGALTMFVPLVGFALGVKLLRVRRKQEQLLIQGEAARVEVISIDLTGKKVNYDTEYAVTLRAPPGVEDGTIVVERSAKAEINWITQRALQKTPVAIIYDPASPEELIFVETLIDD